MTYPDDVLKAAREAAAELTDRLGKHGYRARYERGQFDNSTEVRAACIAIMAERGRCAGIAHTELEAHQRAYPSARDDGQKDRCGARARTAKRIYLAILGQQERSKNG